MDGQPILSGPDQVAGMPGILVQGSPGTSLSRFAVDGTAAARGLAPGRITCPQVRLTTLLTGVASCPQYLYHTLVPPSWGDRDQIGPRGHELLCLAKSASVT